MDRPGPGIFRLRGGHFVRDISFFQSVTDKCWGRFSLNFERAFLSSGDSADLSLKKFPRVLDSFFLFWEKAIFASFRIFWASSSGVKSGSEGENGII